MAASRWPEGSWIAAIDRAGIVVVAAQRIVAAGACRGVAGIDRAAVEVIAIRTREIQSRTLGARRRRRKSCEREDKERKRNGEATTATFDSHDLLLVN